MLSLSLWVKLNTFFFRMRSVWDLERPAMSPFSRSWKTHWAAIPISSREHYLVSNIIKTYSTNSLLPTASCTSSPVHVKTPTCVSFSHKLANGKTRRVMSREEFRLLHYAGEVNYNVNGEMGFSITRWYLYSCIYSSLINPLIPYWQMSVFFYIWYRFPRQEQWFAEQEPERGENNER